MNPKLGQQQSSPDTGWKNLIGQRPWSNSSVKNLLLLIYKGGVYWWDKNRQRKITMTLIQTSCPSCIALAREKKGSVLMRLEVLPQCSNYIELKLKLNPESHWWKNTFHITTSKVWTTENDAYFICQWWNGHHHLQQQAIFPFPTHSQAQRSNHRRRHECSNR